MAKSVYLYPRLTDDIIAEGIFQSKKYTFAYTDSDGFEKELEYEEAENTSSVNCIKTDGVWSADKNNIIIRRSIALRKFKKLFGPAGVACKNAKLGLAAIWTSPDSRQRNAQKIITFGITESEFESLKDHTFVEGEIDIEFPQAKFRGDIRLDIALYIAEPGTPGEDEIHLANEEGFVLGELDTFVLRIDGTGSLFPVYEVNEKDKPLWYVRCDWTDPVADSFTDSVSININVAHKNYKYIDKKHNTFCAQLLVEVMSSALCCIIEKIRDEKYLEQILSGEELEAGSIGQVIKYFSDTLEWDFSTPDMLSLSIREFFDRRISE